MIATALRRAYAAARWLVRLEIGIWRSLFLLVTRRVSGQGPGVRTFSYARQVAPVMAAFIFVSLVELPVVHLLLPWETIRIAVLALSVWGLLWMVGMLASMKVFPHLLDDRELRVRYGTTVDIRIPREAIAGVSARRRSVAGSERVRVERGEAGVLVDVAVLKQTRVDVALHRPTTVQLPAGPLEISGLRFYADDPAALVAAVRETMPPSATIASPSADSVPPSRRSQIRSQ
jgi:hypothetical protein